MFPFWCFGEFPYSPFIVNGVYYNYQIVGSSRGYYVYIPSVGIVCKDLSIFSGQLGNATNCYFSSRDDLLNFMASSFGGVSSFALLNGGSWDLVKIDYLCDCL